MIAVARTSGGLEELDDAIQATGGSATLVPMDLTDMPAIDRLGGAINERWGQARHPGRQCRRTGHDLPHRPRRGQGVREGHDRQRHSHLAGDPLGRAAAAQVRRRPGADPVLGRGPFRPRLLGSLTPPPRPRGNPWPGSGRPRPTRPGSRFNSIDPGAVRTAMRAQAMPGREPRHPCRTPPRSRPSWCRCADLTATVSGKLFRVAEDRLSSTTAFPNRQAGPRPTI